MFCRYAENLYLHIPYTRQKATTFLPPTITIAAIRPGIADGGIFEIRLPELKVKYSELKLGFIGKAMNCSTTVLLLLIAPICSHTIGNTDVVCSAFGKLLGI